MSRREWAFMGVALVLATSVAAGVGVQRYANNAPLPSRTLAAGETLSERGAELRLVSLERTPVAVGPKESLRPRPGAVWVKATIHRTVAGPLPAPSEDAAIAELGCGWTLVTRLGEYPSSGGAALIAKTNSACGRNSTTADLQEVPLRVGQSDDLVAWFEVPGNLPDDVALRLDWERPRGSVLFRP